MSRITAFYRSGMVAVRKRLTLTLATSLAVSAFAAGDATGGEAPDKRACFDAHAKGQVERQAHRLRSAVEQFTTCSNEACPAVAREECGAWLIDVTKAMPSVVPAATDDTGRDAIVVTVRMDGQTLTERLDGRAYDTDPGEHELEFTYPGGAVVKQRVVLNEGEKRRIVRALMPKPQAPLAPSPPAASPTTGPPIAAYIVGGVGVAALGSFALFAVAGKTRENDLKEGCAPHCAEGDVVAMDRRYLAADISLGVGVLSLGAATWLFLSHDQHAHADTSATVGVEPVIGRDASTVRMTGRF